MAEEPELPAGEPELPIAAEKVAKLAKLVRDALIEEFFDEIEETGEIAVIEKDGVKVAVVVRYDDYMELKRALGDG